MKADTMLVKKNDERVQEAFLLLLSYLQQQEALKWSADDFFSFEKEKFKLQMDDRKGPNYLSAKWGVGIDVIECSSMSIQAEQGPNHQLKTQEATLLIDAILETIGCENKATTNDISMPHLYLMIGNCCSMFEQEEVWKELTDRIASLPFQTMIYDRIYLGFADHSVRLVYAK